MKSTSGAYYIGLDHIRAIAAFMVFCWHFLHVNDLHLVAHEVLFLSFFTEGHTGVALFMTLSGYLFAKLLQGKSVDFSQFLTNRAWRLLPLLSLVLLLKGVQLVVHGVSVGDYASTVLSGIIRPTLPNGGWSITAEFHFYIILPFLLYFQKRNTNFLLMLLAVAIIIRTLLFDVREEIQSLAYWTIIGRIDQFLLGIMAYQNRGLIRNRHKTVALIALAFSIKMWWFQKAGGFYENPSYPSTQSFWIYFPTLEGIAYATLIAWYDTSIKHSTGLISRSLALIGKYSYSIYLLHFFYVFSLAAFIHQHIAPITNIYTAFLLSIPAFLLSVPIGHLCYRCIEEPFLRRRKLYLKPVASYTG